MYTIKTSIVLANRRITGLTSRRWQIIHWTYLAVLFLLMPICTLANVFACSPIPAFYNLQFIGKSSDPRKIKCFDELSFGYASRTLHIFTDWLLLPVPLIIIARLQMSLSRKIRLMAIFCVGFVSSLASIMRNILIARIGGDATCEFISTQSFARSAL